MNNKYAVISVMGPHAGESNKEISHRKIMDIKKTGITYWFQSSQKAKPDTVQKLCRESKKIISSCYCIFIKPAGKNGAKPTKSNDEAKMYSSDKVNWLELPQEITPVTGKLNKNAYALVFDKLQIVDNVVDLWKYADYVNQDKSFRTIIGASTVCAIKKDMSRAKDKMISRYREVMAVGQLVKPYCVYLK